METPEQETAVDAAPTSPTVVAEFIIRPGIVPRYCHPEVEQFRDYVNKILDKKTHVGIDSTDQEVPVVCNEALRDCWTEDKIIPLLEDADRIYIILSTTFVKVTNKSGYLPARAVQRFPGCKF